MISCPYCNPKLGEVTEAGRQIKKLKEELLSLQAQISQLLELTKCNNLQEVAELIAQITDTT